MDDLEEARIRCIAARLEYSNARFSRARSQAIAKGRAAQKRLDAAIVALIEASRRLEGLKAHMEALVNQRQ